MPAKSFHGLHALTRRTAEPVLDILPLGRGVAQRTYFEHLLNHTSIIPDFGAAVKWIMRGYGAVAGMQVTALVGTVALAMPLPPSAFVTVIRMRSVPAAVRFICGQLTDL